MTLTIPHPRTGHRVTIAAMAVAVAVVAGIAFGAYQLTDTFDGSGSTRPVPNVNVTSAAPNQGPNQGIAPEATSRPTPNVSSAAPNQGPNQGIAPEATSRPTPNVSSAAPNQGPNQGIAPELTSR